MTTINFPISPTINDIYTLGETSWIWDGNSWNSISATSLIFTGAQGAQGPAGAGEGQGAQGIQGLLGPQGFEGIQGPSGSTLGGGFTQYISPTNGWTRLPNGLYLLWGNSTINANSYKTINFLVTMISFSRIVVSGGDPSGGGGQEENNPYVTACTTTGFTVWNTRNATMTFFWNGVGY